MTTQKLWPFLSMPGHNPIMGTLVSIATILTLFGKEKLIICLVFHSIKVTQVNRTGTVGSTEH